MQRSECVFFFCKGLFLKVAPSEPYPFHMVGDVIYYTVGEPDTVGSSNTAAADSSDVLLFSNSRLTMMWSNFDMYGLENENEREKMPAHHHRDARRRRHACESLPLNSFSSGRGKREKRGAIKHSLALI